MLVSIGMFYCIVLFNPTDIFSILALLVYAVAVPLKKLHVLNVAKSAKSSYFQQSFRKFFPDLHMYSL